MYCKKLAASALFLTSLGSNVAVSSEISSNAPTSSTQMMRIVEAPSTISQSYVEKSSSNATTLTTMSTTTFATYSVYATLAFSTLAILASLSLVA